MEIHETIHLIAEKKMRAFFEKAGDLASYDAGYDEMESMIFGVMKDMTDEEKAGAFMAMQDMIIQIYENADYIDPC